MGSTFVARRPNVKARATERPVAIRILARRLYELRYAARQRLTAGLFIGTLLGAMGCACSPPVR